MQNVTQSFSPPTRSEGRKEILKGIPTDDLSQVIADFESEGAKVSTKQESDGNWTLIAVFED
jgi:hypothetical protein